MEISEILTDENLGGFVSTSNEYVLPFDNDVLLDDVDQLIYHPEDMVRTSMEENIFVLANEDVNANPVGSSGRIVNQVESLQIDATVRMKGGGMCH